MAVTNEMTASELNNYIRGVTGGAAQVQQMLMTNMSGVEGLPYQFMENVDRRIIGTDMGRKYSEKIIARLPLLFLTPCKPVFMDGFNKSDKSTGNYELGPIVQILGKNKNIFQTTCIKNIML